VFGFDSGIEPLRLDRSWGIVRGETRETARAILLSAFHSGDCRERLAGNERGAASIASGSLATLAVGTIVSGIVGYASIWFLLRFLKTHTTGVFIGYRLIVGGAILIML
jgi:undecaprenyl-diphosphatase